MLNLGLPAKRSRTAACGLLSGPSCAALGWSMSLLMATRLAKIAERCQQCTEGRGKALAARLERAIAGERPRPRRRALCYGYRGGHSARYGFADIYGLRLIVHRLARLRGFARALGVPVGELVAAAERDGCQYSRRRFML